MSSTADEAARLALDTVRDSFGWAYGSYWKVDPADRTLLRYAALAVLVRTADRELHGGALALLVRDAEPSEPRRCSRPLPRSG